MGIELPRCTNSKIPRLVDGMRRKLLDLRDGILDEIQVSIHVLVARREPDPLIRQVRNERVFAPRAHDRKMTRIERDVFVALDGVIDAVLVIELPSNELVGKFDDLELPSGRRVSRHTIDHMHLIGDGSYVFGLCLRNLHGDSMWL